jgi:hypothetical protein
LKDFRNLLKHKNIHQIKYIVEAASTGLSTQLVPGNFGVIADYIDKGNFPAIVANREYFPFRTILRNLNQHLSSRLAERLGESH